MPWSDQIKEIEPFVRTYSSNIWTMMIRACKVYEWISNCHQAKWVEDMSKMSLRANDVLPHIERGKQYHSALTRYSQSVLLGPNL